MMLSGNTTTLPDEYRKQLDQFIQDQYPKLRKYARHLIKSDSDQADELLHNVIEELYAGRRTLDFTRSPLTYFQLLLRSVRVHKQINRQQIFEAGTISINLEEKVTIKVGMVPEVERNLTRQDSYRIYITWKSQQSKYRQWILDGLEEGKSIQELHQLRCRVHPIGLLGFRVLVTRLLNQVSRVMQAQSQAEPSNDLGHQQ